MQIIGRRYDTAELVTVDVQDGRIAQIQPVEGTVESFQPSDAPWIAPGFVDLQVNGYGGQEFNDLKLTTEGVAAITNQMNACGVTSYLPTSTTHSFEMLSHALKTIARACDSDPEIAARVPGIHLEGPYLSSEDGPRGAHPREHCRPPDWDEFRRLQDSAGGRICLLTMSPEYDGSPEFIAKVANSGVLVAIGHTAASSDQIRSAVDAGARMSTHLGNGAHGQIRRHPNYIWDQLAEDRLTASLIVDGHHLPSSVVKSFVRAKTPERCVLVSDIVGMAGMPPGRYQNSSLGDIEVLEDGRLVVAGQRQYLAGAALPIGVGVANIMQFAGVDLETAIEMATTRPAQLIKYECGRLEADAPADLIQFKLSDDGDGVTASLAVVATIQAGRLSHGSLWSPS